MWFTLWFYCRILFLLAMCHAVKRKKMSARCSGRGEASLICIRCLHWSKGCIPTPGAPFAAISLGNGLAVQYQVFSDGTKKINTAHTWNLILLCKKSRVIRVMMDDNTPTHKRKKLKTFKNVLSQKLTVDAEVCQETYSKTDSIKME